MDIIKYKNYKKTKISNIFFGSIFLIFVNFIIILYFISDFNRTSNILRKLNEDDPRKKGANEICMLINENDLYDLKDLEDKTYNITSNIDLKFCNNFEDYKSSCLYKSQNNQKIKLSGDIKGEENNKNKIELVENNTLKIYLASGDSNSQGEKYKVAIELQCNKSINDFQVSQVSDFDPGNDVSLTIKGQCKQACVIEDKYGTPIGLAARIIFGIVLLGIGIYIGIFGYRGRKVAIFLVCIAGFALLASIILSLFDVTNLAIIIVVMILFCLVGVGLSIFFVKKQKYLRIYMILVGGITGYVVGNTINNLFISLIDTSKQKLIQILVIVLFIIIGIVVGIFVPKGTYIVGTSVIGSYCLMRALSYFLYDVVPFINELKIYDLAKHGNYEKIAEMVLSLFLIYPSLLIVFVVATIIVQFKLNPKWRDVEDYKLLEKDFDKPLDLPDFKLASDEDDECAEEKDDKNDNSDKVKKPYTNI